MFSPWPRCCPWIVVLVGLSLGMVVGFSGWLVLAIAVACLLLGWWL
jgi:hypothetical protein